MPGLRSGEVADRAGVNIQTLRYYERRGLLPAPDRTLGGHRLYPDGTVRLLTVIKAAQRLGFTLDEIAGLIEADTRRRRPAPGLRQRALAKIGEIDARIAELTAMRGTLSFVAAHCVSLTGCTCPDCPVSASGGSGAADQPVGPVQVHRPDRHQLAGDLEAALRPVPDAPTADHRHAVDSVAARAPVR